MSAYLIGNGDPLTLSFTASTLTSGAVTVSQTDTLTSVTTANDYTDSSFYINGQNAALNIDFDMGSLAVPVTIADAPGSTITVNSGSQVFSQDLTAAGSGGSLVVVSSAGTAVFNTSQTLDTLDISGGGTVVMSPTNSDPSDPNDPDAALLVVSQFVNAQGASEDQGDDTPGPWLGTLDLGDSDMIIKNGGGASGDSASVQSQIAAGRDGTSPSTGRGAWDGTGITSSAALASNNASFIEHMTLAATRNGDLASAGASSFTYFDGVAVTSNDVLVKYTFAGDANLDGKVDGNDYGQIDQGYLFHYTGWINGDFNYDGTVDGNDYSLTDASYNYGGTTLPNPAPAISNGQPSPGTVAEGADFTLNLSHATGVSVGHYVINYGDGSDLQTITGGTSSITHTYWNDGSYTIRAIGTNATTHVSYPATSTVAVTVTPVAPTPTITPETTIADGTAITFDLNANYANPFDADAAGVTWTITAWGDGDTTQAMTASGASTTIVHTYPAGDTAYTITATATDANGSYVATCAFNFPTISSYATGTGSTGTTYYVSPAPSGADAAHSGTGSDSNSGTQTVTGTVTNTYAWATISKVNSHHFAAGDTILFQAGKVFNGTLDLSVTSTYASAATNAATGITIGVYAGSTATPRATIYAAADSGNNGIFIHNLPYVTIKDLTVTTHAFNVPTDVDDHTTDVSQNSTGTGIEFENEGLSTRLAGCSITNVEVSNFGGAGILFLGKNGSNGFSGVTIDSCNVHNTTGDNWDAGIDFIAQDLTGTHPNERITNVHTGVLVENTESHDNSGQDNPYSTGTTLSAGANGSGINIANTDGAVVEHCRSYNNGSRGNGCLGIGSHDDADLTFQYNESFNNTTDGGSDGGGFDFDENVTDSIMQYNYAHDNAGHAFQVDNPLQADVPSSGPYLYPNDGCIVRYNIAQNDGRKHGDSELDIWARVSNALFYNNTVYTTPSGIDATAPTGAIGIHDNSAYNGHSGSPAPFDCSFRNNLLVVCEDGTGTQVPFVNDQVTGASGIEFQKNLYYSEASSAASVAAGSSDYRPNTYVWGTPVSNGYTSIGAWRTGASQETDGSGVGKEGFDPDFVSTQAERLPLGVNKPGSGHVTNTFGVNSPGLFAIRSGSAAKGAGYNLTSSFSGVYSSVGASDFFGSTIPQNGYYDMGACEYQGFTDADVGSPSMTGSGTESFAGVFSLTGGGAAGIAGTGGTTDQFNFDHQTRVGGFNAVARIDTLAGNGNDPYAQTGLMFRNSTDSNSLFASITVTQPLPVSPSSSLKYVDVYFKSRSGTGAGGVQATPVPITSGSNGIILPVWLKLQRVDTAHDGDDPGNTLVGSYSTDGVNWTPVGSVAFAHTSTANTIVTSPLFGIATTSRDSSHTVTASIDLLS